MRVLPLWPFGGAGLSTTHGALLASVQTVLDVEARASVQVRHRT
jgi:hypothetical protein